MNRFLTIVFAYMLSTSSAFASNNAESLIAGIIASDQGVRVENVRVIIKQGSEQVQNKSDLRVISLKLDTKFDNFSATLASGNTDPFVISGKFEKMRKVPTLTRKVNKGETIMASDIGSMEVNEKLLSRGLLTDESIIIGKGAARAIMPNKPLTAQMLVAATVITKGSNVTAIYKSNALTLQNTVTAMEDGAMGETIRLKNTESNRVIHGRITAANTVELTTLNQLASK